MHQYIRFTKNLFSALGVLFQSPQPPFFTHLVRMHLYPIIDVIFLFINLSSLFSRDRTGQTGFEVYTCVCVHAMCLHVSRYIYMCLSIWSPLCGYPLPCLCLKEDMCYGVSISEGLLLTPCFWACILLEYVYVDLRIPCTVGPWMQIIISIHGQKIV